MPENNLRQATKGEMEAMRRAMEEERARLARGSELVNAPAPNITQWQQVLQVCYSTAEAANELARMMNVPIRGFPADGALWADEDPTIAERIHAVMVEIVSVQDRTRTMIEGCMKEIVRICGQLQRQD